MHAIISGTRLALLDHDRSLEEPGEQLRARALTELYGRAGAIARGDNRYATLLTQHPPTSAEPAP